jgi:predicted amidohydrolase YtcJ
MAADLILKALAIITMDPAAARVEAVAIDTTSGTIAAVGTLDACTTAAPTATVRDLGDTVLMPGFIDPHSHPLLGGIVTQEPAHWISPHRGYPHYADVEALWRKLDAELPPGQPVLFNGLDRLLQEAPELTNRQLDGYFPARPALVLDNSGHEVYFNSAVIALNGWADRKPPADPVGARFGRNPDGTSNGRAYETAAIAAASLKLLRAAVPHPLLSAARWYALMAGNGVTSTTEHTYDSSLLEGYVALAEPPDCPLRLALYHMSIDPSCGEKLTSPIAEELLWKQGIKLWADGSPWVGTIAASFPYLDTATVRRAEIPLGPAGESMLNYPRSELDEILAEHAPQGWQMAFHVNGDVGIDVVLDAYERALAANRLTGTDHRWRLEHCGGGRGDQFARAARMGVAVSLLPAQFIYWGDLLDGTMFAPEIGSQWVRAGDAVRAGASVSFHNDGCVSPPIPLLNVQAMVTRRTLSGKIHGANQAVTLHDAFRAHTREAAFQIGRDHDLGSIEVGKIADFVELSADPFTVDVNRLTDLVQVKGTWRGGQRIDLDRFLQHIQSLDPATHRSLVDKAAGRHVCSHGGHGCEHEPGAD